MPTDTQINANRANAQKSTGPRTPAGKAITRFNALKTGIDAESEVIRGEDPAALANLTADFQQQYQPATPSEFAIVDSIVHHVWLQRRLRKVEALLWEGERTRMTNLTRMVPYTDGEVFAGHAGAFSRIQRRIDSTERNLHRSFDELRRQQAARLSSECDASAQDAAQPEPLPPSPQIGSVPPIPATPSSTPPPTPSHRDPLAPKNPNPQAPGVQKDPPNGIQLRK